MGVALVNPGDETATVEFYTVRPDGTTVGKTELTLEPGARLGRLYRELLAASLQQVGGWALVRSSAPLVGVALFGGTNGFALASVPGQAISADYEPPVQVASAITGTVRQAGAGVGDVTVRLAGPVGQTRTTDPEGRYIFGELPPGEYVVTASRLGAELAPAEREVTLGLENVGGQDFEAGGVAPSEAPLVTFVTPTSTFEGNRLLNIKVLGGNFNPASVVVFNGEELQTVFVNAAELQAVIPTRLLTEETDAEIRVVTPPPGGGTSTAAVFVVNPKPSDPLLAGRINVGSFPAGVAVDSGRGIALVTNESGDSVSVVDISREIVTDTIGVGRSPAEGIAIDAERGIALVANVGSNDVSVIDLESEDVRTTIGVGRFPLGVAVDSERGIGLVVNGEDGNVSVVDLDSLTVTGTIGVGDRPAGVAIDLERGEAVVANRGNNTG